VRAALRSAGPPRYSRSSAGSKLDPFREEIHRLLRADGDLTGQWVRELIAPSTGAIRERAGGGRPGLCSLCDPDAAAPAARPRRSPAGRRDLAQVRERYGDRAQTIVNNHRAKILGAGLADPHTLDFAARVLGDEEIAQVSSTAGHEGRGSRTESTTWRALAPAHVLRQAQPGTGVLVYGHLPPARLELRPWFADRGLRALAAAQQDGR